MKKSTIAAVGIIILSVVLTAVSVVLLPNTVVTQLSFSGSGATTMPKFAAIAIPLALSLGGSVSALTVAKEQQAKRKSFIVAIVGIAVFAIMLFVNLAM